ncbi:HTR-like protein [Halobacteriales archaeon QS_8_65_32]|nr:MAG: HTR-like protein [Halobacteriales archaeon QS_8_65_32]
MARTARKVDSLADEEGMDEAMGVVLARADEQGTVEWADVRGDLTSGQWGRLIQTGILVDAGSADGFVLDDPEAVREAVGDGTAGSAAAAGSTAESPSAPSPSESADTGDSADDAEDTSWSTYDKAAAVGSIGMFAGYTFAPVRNVIGGSLDLFLGPLGELLPFYIVVLVLAMFTGLWSTLLQANLMNTEKMGEYQQMFKEQFRPMVWIMLFTIPVFLWMYWKIGARGGVSHGLGDALVVLPFVGEVGWTAGILGPIQAWIIWYFLCSMGFTQIIRKSLNIQTTPTG